MASDACDGCRSLDRRPKSHYLGDKILSHLAEQLGNETFTLATRLGVPYSVLAPLRSGATVDIKGVITEMLRTYLQRSPLAPADKYKDLVQRLLEIHRRDITEKILSRFPFGNEDGVVRMTTNDTKTDNLIEFLASNLTNGWRELGIYLGISLSMLETIEAKYKPTETRPWLKVMQLWSQHDQSESEYEMAEKLKIALKEIQRMDLYGWLEKELERNVEGCCDPAYRDQFLYRMRQQASLTNRSPQRNPVARPSPYSRPSPPLALLQEAPYTAQIAAPPSRSYIPRQVESMPVQGSLPSGQYQSTHPLNSTLAESLRDRPVAPMHHVNGSARPVDNIPRAARPPDAPPLLLSGTTCEGVNSIVGAIPLTSATSGPVPASGPRSSTEEARQGLRDLHFDDALQEGGTADIRETLQNTHVNTHRPNTMSYDTTINSDSAESLSLSHHS